MEARAVAEQFVWNLHMFLYTSRPSAAALTPAVGIPLSLGRRPAIDDCSRTNLA
jgi:hypothetical protein